MTTQRHPIKIRRTQRNTNADCNACDWSKYTKGPGAPIKAQARAHTLQTGHHVTIHYHKASLTVPLNTKENP